MELELRTSLTLTIHAFYILCENLILKTRHSHVCLFQLTWSSSLLAFSSIVRYSQSLLGIVKVASGLFAGNSFGLHSFTFLFLTVCTPSCSCYANDVAAKCIFQTHFIGFRV